ncbi:hypothetical protein EVAR_51262_1 [Eumeta japonica]|uniref:Uncharacterized protein n=1 Tax=Eumeta variegata TaxID=151549 RepID=A0A4C1Y9I8_EUMVA|nr:hypothetical protein EVAR_51262_1 [Eumeta japonica]
MSRHRHAPIAPRLVEGGRPASSQGGRPYLIFRAPVAVRPRDGCQVTPESKLIELDVMKIDATIGWFIVVISWKVFPDVVFGSGQVSKRTKQWDARSKRLSLEMINSH